MKNLASSSSVLSFAWLLIIMMMATSALSQSDDTASVLDTNGRPLQRGDEYYINPAITDSGGRFTLIDRNNSCPLYVGQLINTDAGEGLPVTFTPYATEDDVIKVNRDFKVAFAAASTCVQSTEWKVGARDAASGRRLIVASGSNGDRDYSGYFRIVETQSEGIYNIQWCPTEVCPTCRFDCGTMGGLRENGKILEALDGNVLPVVFERRA